jgi:methionyl-tRNA formyltransferase
MNVIFMGNPSFAANVLEGLTKSHHRVVGVVTSTDRPQNRGMDLHPTEVKVATQKLNIQTLIEQDELKEPTFIERLKSLNAEIVVVVAFKYLPGRVYKWAKFGGLNLHGSLLPELRGPAPVPWAILRGYSETGVTAFSLSPKIDAGIILGQKSIQVDNRITAPDLFDKLAIIGTRLLIQVLDNLENGTSVPLIQDNNQATQAPLLTKELGLVEWQNSATYISRQVRALQPWPSTYTFRNQIRLRLDEVEIVAHFSNAEPGTVIKAAGFEFIVATGKGCIQINKLTPASKKTMFTDEYLRGYPVQTGEKLG